MKFSLNATELCEFSEFRESDKSLKLCNNNTVHTEDKDFEVTEFSLFTFWWACAELTSCLGIAMYKIFKAILLFTYASYETDMDLG